MPLYKYFKHEISVRRSERRHRRMRLAALVISSVLLIGALAMLAGRVLLDPARTVSIPAVQPLKGAAAAVLSAGGR